VRVTFISVPVRAATRTTDPEAVCALAGKAAMMAAWWCNDIFAISGRNVDDIGFASRSGRAPRGCSINFHFFVLITIVWTEKTRACVE